MITSEQAEAALEAMKKLGDRFAHAKAQRIYLEEYRKTKKALLMSLSDSTSAAMKEADAYSHPEYLEVLQGLKAAVEEEEKHRWKLVAAETQVMIWRTQESSRRKELS